MSFLDEPFGYRDLVGRFPEWRIELHAYKVTAVLRSGAGPAYEDPVAVSVMRDLLTEWRVQQGTAHCRMNRHAGPG